MVKKFTVPDDNLEELIFQYCRDFTELERQGRFDPITGRDKEIDELILILLQLLHFMGQMDGKIPTTPALYVTQS